jgi:ATP-dependent RNA helicase SUPV3L1/SUV3
MFPRVGSRSLACLAAPASRRCISFAQPQWRQKKNSTVWERDFDYLIRGETPWEKRDRFKWTNDRLTRLNTGTNLQGELERFLSSVNRRIEEMLYSARVRAYVGPSRTDDEFEEIVAQFKDAVMSNLTERMGDGKYREAPPKTPTPEELFEIYTKEGKFGLDQLISSYFKQYLIYYGRLPAGRNYDIATSAADMRNPGEWYPGARSIRRKIVMHVGPTNSGKTYQALQKLERAKSGWYGGPLRLLAHEVFNRMNNKGIKCNLRTGEEIRTIDINAPLTASTIEMFSESALYDIAVIDEIQMLADPQRGYAWTAALLGLKAKEVHLCGEEAAVPLVTAIAKELGEELEVNRYNRLSPLRTDSRPLRKLTNIRAGDCIVAFSRASIFKIRDEVEKATGMRCALVYGALPPETRALQANLFNDPKSGYDILVASDAIGMGLNLYIFVWNPLITFRNIKRVIFSSLMKFDSTEQRQLLPPQIKQIAGRAGRFGTPGSVSDPSNPFELGGLVTSLEYDDMAVIREAMATPNSPLERAYLWPPWKIFEKFTHHFPENTPLATMISRFVDVSKTTGIYQSSEGEVAMTLAHAIEHLPNIDLESRYSISFAPLQPNRDEQIDAFVRFAEVLSATTPITIESPRLKLPLEVLETEESGPHASPTQLKKLETLHKLITCYCWLAYKIIVTY